MSQTLIALVLAASTLLTVVLLCLPKQYSPDAAPTSDKKASSDVSKRAGISVQVLVLGDLGRSPRMQYHALSIANHGAQVQLIGYLDTEPLSELRAHRNANIVPLSASPKYLQTSNRLLFLVFAPLKVLHQIWNLWLVLGYQTTPAKWLLVQNPPSIPMLLVASIVCFLRHTRLVIDWHNFGYSILALKLGRRHPFVWISRLYEKIFARFAYAHFAVTDAMSALLKAEYVPVAPVMTLHDRPAAVFRPLPSSERLAFLSWSPLTSAFFDAIAENTTRLVVSSTSWTPDEDFGVLLQALCQYSALATSTAPQLPELLVIITGKGPQQQHYVDEIKKLKQKGELEMVTIKTAWLKFEDYASLLASADLGVSLHTSSSGVDLPMKVVDMFGAGLPVLGFNNFKAWSELVTEGFNGRGFATAGQMTNVLTELFQPGAHYLKTLKRGAVHESGRRWGTEWDPIAGRLFGLVP